MVTVQRTRHVIGRRRGLTTLQQTFLFQGDGAQAAAIAAVLLGAPLTGERSVFGNRPGEEDSGGGSSRTLHRFSPAPGYRFDVDLVPQDGGVFLVQFSQPDRNVPYLDGGLVWTLSDEADGAVLDEQINTEQALRVATEPLTGPRPSLRRWMFFRAGHAQVMRRATNNVAMLLGPQAH